MTQVTLELPDEVWEHARQQAEEARCSVEELFTRSVRAGAREEDRLAETWKYIDLGGLPDEELRVVIRANLPDDLQERLSELLELNSEGDLPAKGRAELDELMKKVHTGTMLRAVALLAWVRRHGSPPPFMDMRGIPTDAASRPA
jgi:hypothetical protein